MTSRFKQIIPFLILYTLYSILYTPAAYAAGASLSLSPASGSYKTGSLISVAIVLDAAGNETSGADVILLYEPEKLGAEAITSGAIYTSYPVKTISSSAGRISISGIMADPAASFNSQGTFATVKFKVLTAGTTALRFDFRPDAGAPGSSQDSNVAKKGSLGEDILSSVSNATYTFSATGGGITPVPTVTPPTSGVVEITAAVFLGGLGLLALGLKLLRFSPGLRPN